MSFAIPGAPPIDVPVGPVPSDYPRPNNIPTPGDVINYVGAGIVATGEDVWHWIQGRAAPVVNTLANIETTIANDVVNTVEAYVIAAEQTAISFVNDTVDMAVNIADNAFAQIGALAVDLVNDVQAIDGYIYGLLEDVAGIDNIVIPAIEGDIAALGIDTEAFIKAGIADVQGWAIDNIYDPLTAEIERTAADVRAGAFGAAVDALSAAESYTDAHIGAIAATIAGLAAAVATVTTFVDDCGEPMCQVQGPNTDLGKLLKGLQAALAAGAFLELANARESDVADAITRIAHHAGTVIDTFETDFLNSTNTLATLVADELQNVI